MPEFLTFWIPKNIGRFTDRRRKNDMFHMDIESGREQWRACPDIGPS
jgi:hypothetical protein